MAEHEFPEGSNTPQPDQDPHHTRQRHEKDEKDEKSYQKHDEKSWEEKWHRDPLSGIVWALVLVWFGVAWLLGNAGLLSSFGNLDPWQVGMIGAGGILLLSVVVRLLIPEYRGSVISTLIVGVVFVGVGLGSIISWTLVWPIVIIVVGLVILVRIFTRLR